MAVLGRYARAYADVAVKQKVNPEKTIAEFEQMAAASPVRYEPYRMGSAFLRTAADGA